MCIYTSTWDWKKHKDCKLLVSFWVHHASQMFFSLGSENPKVLRVSFHRAEGMVQNWRRHFHRQYPVVGKGNTSTSPRMTTEIWRRDCFHGAAGRHESWPPDRKQISEHFVRITNLLWTTTLTNMRDKPASISYMIVSPGSCNSWPFNSEGTLKQSQITMKSAVQCNLSQVNSQTFPQNHQNSWSF